MHTTVFHSALKGAATRLGWAAATAALAAALFASGASAAPAQHSWEYGTSVRVSTGGAGLNVRSGPGLGYSVYTARPSGSYMKVVAGPVYGSGYYWYKVTGNGVTGWSAGAFLYSGSRNENPHGAAASRGDSGGSSVGGSSSATPRRSTSGPTYSMRATAYNGAEFGSAGIMANGQRVYWGAVAVDPNVIPLGTRMYISGFGDKVFVASDTGSAIKGYRIDIWYPSVQAALEFGVQQRTVTIIR